MDQRLKYSIELLLESAYAEHKAAHFLVCSAFLANNTEQALKCKPYIADMAQALQRIYDAKDAPSATVARIEVGTAFASIVLITGEVDP